MARRNKTTDLTPVTLVAGEGADTLVLKVSQDAYLGSAQYTVSIDGKQIGGTFTAHASHSAGQFDMLTLHGDFSAGQHQVTVNFLNDLHKGSAATDRNLYVGGATFNGSDAPNAHLDLLTSGPASFSFTDDAVPTSIIPAVSKTLVGVYAGQDPADYMRFDQWLGKPSDGYLGYTGDRDWWDMDPSWTMSQLQKHPIFFSIPLFPQTSTLAAVADGAGDVNFRAIAQKILANADQVAAPDGSIYIRTGWEVGAEWFWWSQQALDRPDLFVQAFQHFADAFHAVSDKFKIVWDSAGDRGDVTKFYPGDHYVDVISRDVYWFPEWRGPDGAAAFTSIRDDAYGLQWVENFADQHGKPTAISEWGVPAGYDATTFIQAMKKWIDDPEHDVLYQTYWDSDVAYSGLLSDGSDPASGAAFRDAFGELGS